MIFPPRSPTIFAIEAVAFSLIISIIALVVTLWSGVHV